MDFSKLQHFLDCLEAFDVHEFDLAVYQDHKQIYRYMGGYADEERTRPIQGKELRWIYSMSKVITCSAVLRLVERGKLSLEDPVSRYLPEYGEMEVQQGETLVRAQNPILVRHLFAMQSGLDYSTNVPAIHEAREKQLNTREIVRAIATKPLRFEPGTDVLYGLSHDVLAAVAEVVADKSWHEYLKAEVFEPLGMYDVGFHPTPEQMERFTQKYLYDTTFFRRKPGDMLNGFRYSDHYESGGAGLFCSVDDYMKVIDALANFGTAANGYELLRPETVRLMRTNQVPGNRSALNKRGYGYALGVRTLIDKKEARSLTPIGEFGWDGAANSYNLIDPENRLAIGFFTHIHGTGFFNRVTSPQISNLVYEILGIATPYR